MGPYHVAGCTNIFESESLAKLSSYLVELSVVQIMLCLTAQTSKIIFGKRRPKFIFRCKEKKKGEPF